VGACVVAAPALVATEEPGLAGRVAALREEHERLWATTPAELPALGPRSGFRLRLGNEYEATRLIDALAAEVERVPEGERERHAWRESVRERVQAFGAARLGWPEGYGRLLCGDAFFQASIDFTREARAFDPSLPPDGLWQALRNVWIGNTLQLLLGRPVTVHPGLFAYSMLYPLTDNLLDDPGLGGGAKREFNERFGRRLAGLPVTPVGAREEAVFRLVARIEEEFPRSLFADVHASLLAIHGGQVRSLLQQDDPAVPDDRILAISCEKGGSSVLADLYLVTGDATASLERFAFGYGVFLQLLDDLQDVETDRAAGHQTLFTRAAQRGPLDEAAARLARFIDRVLDGAEILAGPGAADHKDLVRRSCQNLLVGAMAEQPHRFSRGLRRSVERQWPFSLAGMRRLHRRAERRFTRAATRLQARRGAASLLDLAAAEVSDVPALYLKRSSSQPSVVRSAAPLG
jgi:hypothetical protein